MSSKPAFPIAAFGVAALGIASFSIMDGVMKALVLAIGAYNAMLWRQIASLGLGGTALMLSGARWPSKAVMRLHALRGFVGGLLAFAFFWGIARVPLAEGIALSFIAPLITLYLAAALLKERISRQSILASVLGMAGVVVIAMARLGDGLGGEEALWGMAAIFVSAVLYAYNLILQRQQAQVAGPVEVAFYANVFALATMLLAAPWFAAPLDLAQLPMIVLAALLSFVSMMLLSWAYGRAEAQVLVPVEYTAFIWAALVGWFAFAEPITPSVLAGAALIVIGCLIAARQRPEHIEAATL